MVLTSCQTICNDSLHNLYNAKMSIHSIRIFINFFRSPNCEICGLVDPPNIFPVKIPSLKIYYQPKVSKTHGIVVECSFSSKYFLTTFYGALYPSPSIAIFHAVCDIKKVFSRYSTFNQ